MPGFDYLKTQDEFLYFSGVTSIFCFLSFIIFKTQQAYYIFSDIPDGSNIIKTFMGSIGLIFYQDVLFALAFLILAFTGLSLTKKNRGVNGLLRCFIVFLAVVVWIYGFLNNTFFKHMHEQFTFGYAVLEDLDDQILAYFYEELTLPLSLINYAVFIILFSGLYLIYSRKPGIRFFSRKLMPLLFSLSIVFLMLQAGYSHYSPPEKYRASLEIEVNYIHALFSSMYYELFEAGDDVYHSKVRVFSESDKWEYVSEDYPYLKKYVGDVQVENKFNVVVIIVESLTYMDLSRNNPDFYSTPFIDNLSQKSLFFERFYATAPTSSKSLVSMLCSVYPSPSAQLITRKPSIPLRCMPEILKERGYSTAIFHAGYFQHHSIIKFLKKREFDTIFRANDIPPEKAGAFKKNMWGYQDHIMLPYIKSWINETNKPFLLVYFTVSEHHPYNLAPNEYKRDISGLGKRWVMHLNNVRYSDAFIEDLYGWLEEEGLVEDTIIVITGDHGENLNKSYARGRCLYDPCIHVPCIISNPRLFNRTYVATETASHVDLVPTIMDILSIYPWNHYQGKSIFDPEEGRVVMVSTITGGFGLGVDDYFFIYNRKTGVSELYNVTADPNQVEDLAESLPKVSNRFKNMLEEWIDHQSYMILNKRFMPENKEELTGGISGIRAGGNVMVNSTPGGATVYLDGKKIEGTTPVLIQYLKLGKHRLRISKPGYKDKSRKNLRVRPGRTKNIHLRLRPIKKRAEE
jgi:phosphoglycerol transferase MdoB-like AlkP superfamily enzyme